MRLKKIVLLSCVMGFLVGCSNLAVSKDQLGQTLSIEELMPLPKKVSETSGLARFGQYLWTINDSGGKDSVYAFGEHSYDFVKRVKIEGAKNIDWESLAQDDKSLFIADCGNNRGKRKKLNIYKVSLKKLVKAKHQGSVPSKKITFSYADREAGDVGKRHNFDCEALTVVGHQLWLFTKNRGDLQTRLYVLNKNKKQQKLEPLMTLPVSGLITAADYDEKSNKLVLLGYQKASPFGQSFIWIVDIEAGLPVWERAVYHTILPYGQWESVLWETPEQLLLTSEKSPLGSQKVGRLHISD
jgi:hypothetical protein